MLRGSSKKVYPIKTTRRPLESNIETTYIEPIIGNQFKQTNGGFNVHTGVFTCIDSGAGC
ncbi:hypothetical protein D3C77_210550 [compost metagenome]